MAFVSISAKKAKKNKRDPAKKKKYLLNKR